MTQDEAHKKATELFNKIRNEEDPMVFYRLGVFFEDYYEGMYSYDDNENVVFILVGDGE